MSEKKVILLVEGDEANRKAFERFATENGHTVLGFEDPGTALRALQDLRWNNPTDYANAMLVTDRFFAQKPGVEKTLLDEESPAGEELAKKTRAEHPAIPILMWKSSATESWFTEMRAAGADHASNKPIEAKEMQAAIEETLKNFELREVSPRQPGGSDPARRINQNPGRGLRDL